MWLFLLWHVNIVDCTLLDGGKKGSIRATMLWNRFCGSFQMALVRKWHESLFSASKDVIISALLKYKIFKRGGLENLCGQTEAAFIKYKREGNNFGFQKLPVLSRFVLAVLITSSSVEWVWLTLCIRIVFSIFALHLAGGTLPHNKWTTKNA